MHVLVVDDDPGRRDATVAMLRDAGHDAICACDAAEGLGRLDVDLVITALRLPGMDGAAFARQVHERRPEMPVFLASEQRPDASARDAFDAVLSPPLDASDLQPPASIASGPARAEGDPLDALIAMLGDSARDIIGGFLADLDDDLGIHPGLTPRQLVDVCHRRRPTAAVMGLDDLARLLDDGEAGRVDASFHDRMQRAITDAQARLTAAVEALGPSPGGRGSAGVGRPH